MSQTFYFDARTLNMITTFVWLLSSITLIIIWKTQKTYQGFGYWTLYSVCVTIGSFLTFFHGIAPLFVPALIGNGFYFTSAFLALNAVKKFLGQKTISLWYWSVPLTVELILAWFVFVSPNIIIRALVITLFIGISTLIIGWKLSYRTPIIESRFSSHLTGLLVITHGVYTLIRGLLIVFLFPIQTYFAPNIFQLSGSIASITLGLLGSFGIIMMNSQRLEHELKTTGDKLQTSLQELEQKMSDIKILSGLLPTCSSCKKIRDDEGNWIQMESYIHRHSEAQFSHGICPDCKQSLYGEFLNKK